MVRWHETQRGRVSRFVCWRRDSAGRSDQEREHLVTRLFRRLPLGEHRDRGQFLVRGMADEVVVHGHDLGMRIALPGTEHMDRLVRVGRRQEQDHIVAGRQGGFYLRKPFGVVVDGVAGTELDDAVWVLGDDSLYRLRVEPTYVLQRAGLAAPQEVLAGDR